jgi:hypothetical protein
MREAHERDTGDNADTEPDSRPDAAAGRGSDSRRPAIPIVRDSATWIALALEYRKLVEETRVASGSAGTDPRDDREDRTLDEGDQVSDPPPGKDTGSKAMITMGRTRVPGSRRGEPTFPSMHGSCRTRGTSCRTWRGPKSTSGSSASTQ